MVLVKFYCDVITRSRLIAAYQHFDRHLFNKLCSFMPFKWNKEEEGRPVMVKSQLDGAVDKSSADGEIRKSYATVHNF